MGKSNQSNYTNEFLQKLYRRMVLVREFELRAIENGGRGSSLVSFTPV